MSFVLLNNKKPSLILGNCKFLKKTTIQNAGREQGYPKKKPSRGNEPKHVQAISCIYCTVSIQSILKNNLFHSSVPKVLSPGKTLKSCNFSCVSSTALCPSGDLLSNFSCNLISTFLAQRNVYTGSYSQQSLVIASSLKWM